MEKNRRELSWPAKGLGIGTAFEFVAGEGRGGDRGTSHEVDWDIVLRWLGRTVLSYRLGQCLCHVVGCVGLFMLDILFCLASL